jgi:hypothetical protein
MKAYRVVDVQTHVFLTSALVGGQWSASRPGHTTPEKRTPVPIGYEIEWTLEPVWTTWRRENSWPHRDSNSEPSVVQPVASRYTDCAIPSQPSHKRTIKGFLVSYFVSVTIYFERNRSSSGNVHKLAMYMYELQRKLSKYGDVWKCILVMN